MSNQKQLLLALLLTLGCLTFITSATAQSGRRVKKTTPAPVPTPESAPTPKAVVKPKVAFTFIVGMERDSVYRMSPTVNWGSILLTFCDRLNDNPSVDVEPIRGDISRSEAIRRAKAAKEAYVAWLEVRTNSRMGSSDDSQLFVEYWVFSPGTAKLKASGRVYPQAYRNRGVILNPRPPDIYDDYRLQQAARQAAERVLDSFDLSVPDRTKVRIPLTRAENTASQYPR